MGSCALQKLIVTFRMIIVHFSVIFNGKQPERAVFVLGVAKVSKKKIAAAFL